MNKNYQTVHFCKETIININILKFSIITITIFLIVGCSNKQLEYHFDCKYQNRSVILTNITTILSTMGYSVTLIDTMKNIIVAEKIITQFQNKKGWRRELLQMEIEYNFTNDNSKMLPYYVVEQNQKRSIKQLNNEQKRIYNNDFLEFKGKMIYYCDPRFYKLP